MRANYQSKHTAALSTRGFYTILSLCALIIAASAWVIWGNAHRQNAVEPDTGMPIIAPADSTAEAPDRTGHRSTAGAGTRVSDRGAAGRGGRAGTGGDGLAHPCMCGRCPEPC